MSRFLLVLFCLFYGAHASAYDEVVNPIKGLVPDHKLPPVNKETSNEIAPMMEESQQEFIEIDYEGESIEPVGEYKDALYDLINEDVKKITIQSFGFSESAKPHLARQIALNRAVELRALLMDEGIDENLISIEVFHRTQDQINKVMVVVDK